MANQKILDKKQEIIDEIAEKTKNASATVLFEYQGLTVDETNELRRALKENDSEFKIYKNTLVKRAFDTLKIDLTDDLKGPKAMAFGNDAVAPVKVLYDFKPVLLAASLTVIINSPSKFLSLSSFKDATWSLGTTSI